MWKVMEHRLNGDDRYLHAFDLKRDAKAFERKWFAANPGKWTFVVKVQA
jgi:hypothetical protein